MSEPIGKVIGHKEMGLALVQWTDSGLRPIGTKLYGEQDKCDAERYRWLKANHLQTGADSWIRTGEDLEEAIDAAMKSQ